MARWIFGIDEEVKEFYEVIYQKDPVLKAASEEIYGAHLCTDPYVFELIIGVVVAQNVQFQRVYKMTELLCKKFGETKKFNGKTYYTFPTPERLASASLSQIRSCKGSYRDKYVKGIAKKVVNENINLDDLRKNKRCRNHKRKTVEISRCWPIHCRLSNCDKL